VDDDAPAIPIVHGDTAIGELRVQMRTGDTLGPRDTELLRDLASHAAVAVENARLAQELRRSRLRIVAAQDAERRRVERDLHDGAQQRLLSVALALRMARRDPVLLDEASEQLDGAIDELRDLARGIYPAVLVDGGLAPALDALSERSPVPVELHVTGERFPPPIEATAYFTVSEALTNVVKHSGASVARVCVGRDGDVLRVSVGDDGTGGADAARGSGLRGLSDRAAALSGSLVVESSNKGTTLTLELPCA
jgi:signal transduction histidine kinase